MVPGARLEVLPSQASLYRSDVVCKRFLIEDTTPDVFNFQVIGMKTDVVGAGVRSVRHVSLGSSHATPALSISNGPAILGHPFFSVWGHRPDSSAAAAAGRHERLEWWHATSESVFCCGAESSQNHRSLEESAPK